MNFMNTKHKHILFDTTALQTGHAARGIGTYTRNLAKQFDLLQLKGVSIHTQKKSLRKRFPDLVHIPYFDLFAPTLGLALRQKRIVTIHDVIPLIYPEHFPVGKKGKLSHKWQKTALKKVNHIITDSNSSKSDIVSYLNQKPEKISVVYLAADEALHKPTQEKIDQVIEKLKLPNKYILYVGDINYNKNLPQLIKALKYLDDSIHLVCVGKNFYDHPIPEWDAIEKQIALSDVSQRIHFITDVPTGDIETLSAIYGGSICYVQPSLYEGFGLPILEAMKCRTPVVAAATSSLSEVAGTHALFSQPVAEKFAEKILDILSWNNDRRKEFTKKAEEWSDLFSWEASAKQTIEIYGKVLGFTPEYE